MLAINEAVRDKPISADISCSAAVLAIMDGLAELSELVDEIPPAQHALRYGNPAFRQVPRHSITSIHQMTDMTSY